MWYVKCAGCGNKIWEGQDASLVLKSESGTNGAIGRIPFCDSYCLCKYFDAIQETLVQDEDNKYGLVWKEDKRRKRLPNEHNMD